MIKYSELSTSDKKIVTSAAQLKTIQSSLKSWNSIDSYLQLLNKL
jgi:hypothetical protein